MLTEVTVPALSRNTVMVKVHAAALNRIDLRMARGLVHGSSGGLGKACGMEWAGEIVEIGSDVTGWTAGQRVMGVGAGAFAEFLTADPGVILEVPEGLSYHEAATLPVGLQTMHDALVAQGRFRAGQNVLIQGASSGMGLMGMQIARELGAGLIIGTSTDADRRQRLGEFGADMALDSRADDWVTAVLTATGNEGVDILLDLVAGPLVIPGMRATKVGGRMVNIGRVGGEQGAVDFDLHSLRRIQYVGTTFRTRGPKEVSDVVAAATRDLRDAIGARRITMPVAGVYRLDQVDEAFAQMERNQHFGKLVLSVEERQEGTRP
ncbi:zinc-binding dehydrogenase [Mycobacterium sp. NAZ190054]|uniref:quinone oxidoreductase family protein n=1 Tax=Mycobacterium sp. NAZ190054 TaxID=1747766 RepID=UPI0018D252DD|nr:zinc-binding dehydrogenase [Mycobacterium sp. NAZ190054]